MIFFLSPPTKAWSQDTKLYSNPVILGLNQNIFLQPILALRMNVYFIAICYGSLFYFIFKGEKGENSLELDFSLPLSRSFHSEPVSDAQRLINRRAV